MRMPKNLGWKFGALFAAFLLWVAISATPDTITDHATPILYRNLASSLIVTGDFPEMLHIELRGTAGELTTSALADTVEVCDLSGVKGPGDHTFTISEANLNLPPGVTFVRAVPSQLHLHFVHQVVRDVPVEVQFLGNPPAGYHIRVQEVMPAALRVVGAEARIGGVNKVETDPIDVSRLTQAAEFRVDVFATDPQVRFESSPMVTVKLAVERTGK
jgi:hypothetical protein